MTLTEVSFSSGTCNYRSISAVRARAQQQTNRTSLLLSIDGTDRRTDIRPLHRACSAYCVGSVKKRDSSRYLFPLFLLGAGGRDKSEIRDDFLRVLRFSGTRLAAAPRRNRPGARFTNHLTIYHKTILSL